MKERPISNYRQSLSSYRRNTHSNPRFCNDNLFVHQSCYFRRHAHPHFPPKPELDSYIRTDRIRGTPFPPDQPLKNVTTQRGPARNCLQSCRLSGPLPHMLRQTARTPAHAVISIQYRGRQVARGGIPATYSASSWQPAASCSFFQVNILARQEKPLRVRCFSSFEYTVG